MPLFAIVMMSAAGWFTVKRAARERILHDPKLKEGYDRFLRNYLIYANIPWVVMGIGLLFDSGTKSSDYIPPKTGSVAIIAFHVSMIFFWAVALFWTYFRGGAQFFVDHPGILAFNWQHGDLKSPLAVKLIIAVVFLGLAFGEYSMWTQPLPVPHPR